MTDPRVEPYDAVLLVSFGGPEKPEDVVPFLENVTRGRNVDRRRLLEVGDHYFRFGGRSPINDQCRALRSAIEADFAVAGVDVPVYWGNRNWSPYLVDTLRQMRADGVQRAAYFLTSAYSSYSSCRQYREDVAAARAELGPDAPRLDQLPAYFERSGFLEPFVDATAAAMAELPAGSRLVFVTHSIPVAMNDASGPEGGAYVAQHRRVAQMVSDQTAVHTGAEPGFDLIYCSRSGPPNQSSGSTPRAGWETPALDRRRLASSPGQGQPWLEPDVNDHLTSLASRGVPGVAVVPIGFVSDHMEVVYDLDTEAAATAEKLGLPMVRAATPGVDPRYVALVRELLLERAAEARGERGPVPTDGARPGCGVGTCCARRATGS